MVCGLNIFIISSILALNKCPRNKLNPERGGGLVLFSAKSTVAISAKQTFCMEKLNSNNVCKTLHIVLMFKGQTSSFYKS